jgi:hypothetical protein
MAEKTQPMALPGRWATTRAPTPVKAAKASSSPTVSASGWCWKLPLAIDSATSATTLTTHATSSAQATQVERLRIGRHLVIGVSVLLPAILGRHRPGTVTERLSR